MSLRQKLIKLAHDNPGLRRDILPLLKQAGSLTPQDEEAIRLFLEGVGQRPLKKEGIYSNGRNLYAVDENGKGFPIASREYRPGVGGVISVTGYGWGNPTVDGYIPLVTQRLERLVPRLFPKVKFQKYATMASPDFRAFGPAFEIINKSYELEGEVLDQLSRVSSKLFVNAEHLGLDRRAMGNNESVFRRDLEKAFDGFRKSLIQISKESEAYKEPALYWTMKK